jgi:trimethylamine--corrinoid protein Co-methyltransferase
MLLIKEIGPFNDFLSHPSTLKYARSQSRHEIIDRKIRTEWESTGSRDTAQSALEKAKWILENHEIKTPISEGQQKEIKKNHQKRRTTLWLLGRRFYGQDQNTQR